MITDGSCNDLEEPGARKLVHCMPELNWAVWRALSGVLIQLLFEICHARWLQIILKNWSSSSLVASRESVTTVNCCLNLFRRLSCYNNNLLC